MLKVLGNTTASASSSSGSIAMEVCGGEEGLSMWELVNAAHSEDEDLYSYDSEETVSIGDDLEPITDEKDDDDVVDVDDDAPAPRGFLSPSDIIAIQATSVFPPINFPVEMARNYVAHDYAQEYYADGDVNGVSDGDDDGNDENVDDDYDVDDELVPRKLKGRFGKQRIIKMGIRKMGQRGGPKLKAKKMPYYDNRPGFSYGKLR